MKTDNEWADMLRRRRDNFTNSWDDLASRAEKAEAQLAVQLAANEELRKQKEEAWQIMFDAQKVVMQGSARQCERRIQAEQLGQRLTHEITELHARLATDAYPNLRHERDDLREELHLAKEMRAYWAKACGKATRELYDLRARLGEVRERLVWMQSEITRKFQAGELDEMWMYEALADALVASRAEGKGEPEQLGSISGAVALAHDEGWDSGHQATPSLTREEAERRVRAKWGEGARVTWGAEKYVRRAAAFRPHERTWTVAVDEGDESVALAMLVAAVEAGHAPPEARGQGEEVTR